VAQLYPPGTGYPFQSPLMTRMGYGETILSPRSPHENPLPLNIILL